MMALYTLSVKACLLCRNFKAKGDVLCKLVLIMALPLLNTRGRASIAKYIRDPIVITVQPSDKQLKIDFIMTPLTGPWTRHCVTLRTTRLSAFDPRLSSHSLATNRITKVDAVGSRYSCYCITTPLLSQVLISISTMQCHRFVRSSSLSPQPIRWHLC